MSFLHFVEVLILVGVGVDGLFFWDVEQLFHM